MADASAGISAREAEEREYVGLFGEPSEGEMCGWANEGLLASATRCCKEINGSFVTEGTSRSSSYPKAGDANLLDGLWAVLV